MAILGGGRRKLSRPVRRGRSVVRSRSTRKLAYSAYKKATRISRNYVRPEYKVIDTLSGSLNPYNAGLGTGQFILLNGCSPGDGLSSRDGREITIKSLQLQFYYATSVNITVPSLVRYVLFIDKSPMGVVPTVAQLLEITDTSFPIASAYRDLDNRKRFVILRDGKLNIAPQRNISTTNNRFIKTVVKFKKMYLRTVYNAGTAGTIVDINQGAIYFYIFSDNSSVSYPDTCQIYSRIRFVDN